MPLQLISDRERVSRNRHSVLTTFAGGFAVALRVMGYALLLITSRVPLLPTVAVGGIAVRVCAGSRTPRNLPEHEPVDTSVRRGL